jgi:glycosyltransferase involved in cell wall biosynthesis
MRIALLGNPDSLHVQRWTQFLVSRGHELLLVTDPHTRRRIEGCRQEVAAWNPALNFLAFRLTPRPHGNSLWKPWLYRPILASFRPDVVHGFEAYYNGLATAWAGRFPKVLSPWGRDIFFDGLSGGLAGWMVRRALRGVDRITCNDESIGSFLSGAYGIEAERIVPFSWGIDLKVFQKVDADRVIALRAELGLEAGARVIPSPRKWGRLWGSEQIAAALPGVLSAVREVVAVLIAPAAGDEAGAALRAELERGCDSGRLRWLPPDQPAQRMAELYSMAEIFVSAAPKDLLAQTVLEGMACGCFPVLSNLPAYARHARTGERALLFPAEDTAALGGAMIRALEDGPLRERAASLNIDAMRREEDASVNMLKMEDVYAGALAAHARDRRR